MTYSNRADNNPVSESLYLVFKRMAVVINNSVISQIILMKKTLLMILINKKNSDIQQQYSAHPKVSPTKYDGVQLQSAEHHIVCMFVLLRNLDYKVETIREKIKISLLYEFCNPVTLFDS